jgi:RNA polymerase sigma factor (sigma-70 family)
MGYLKRILPVSAEEEADLLALLWEFEDPNARDRLITAHLPIVVPIALKQARKFRLDVASTLPEFVAEGNLHLVLAVDAFPPRSNVRLANYARRCIRNGIVRYAVSCLSVVHHPWGKRAKQDLYIDPTRPDLVGAEENTGCKQAKPTTGKNRTNLSYMRSEPESLLSFEGIRLPQILEARVAGLKLREIAQHLGVSIPTAHRRVKAAIEEVRHHA